MKMVRDERVSPYLYDWFFTVNRYVFKNGAQISIPHVGDMEWHGTISHIQQQEESVVVPNVFKDNSFINAAIVAVIPFVNAKRVSFSHNANILIKLSRSRLDKDEHEACRGGCAIQLIFPSSAFW
jgi:hypothetical protein